jgi:outer membrane protein assembly factor BamB
MYVPSLVVTEGHVFGVLDSGRAACWNAETGVELWRDKVNREVFSSPVVARGRIYVTGVDGVTTVLAADPRRLTVLAQNALGDEAYASPAIAGNRLFLRHAKKGEPRQEYLWCIGK